MPKYPEWLDQPQPVVPPHSASRFLSKNLANLAHVLAHFNHSHHVQDSGVSAWVGLVSLLVDLLLIVTCQNIWLFWGLWLVQLIALLRLPGALLGGLLKATLKSLVFGAIVVLPSIWLTSAALAGWWLAKLALVMLTVQLFRHRHSWRAILIGLRQLHVPSLFVLTLDITVKYSHVLGSSLQASLEAVWLRSCGRIEKPLPLAATLLGQLYLQSRHQASALYDAMWLRGYNATPAPGKLAWHRQDWSALGLDLALIALAIVL